MWGGVIVELWSTTASILSSERCWVALSALASACAAIATYFLARYTRDLAVETRDSLRVSRQALEDERKNRDAEDLRHMDGLMPHIAVEIRDEILELASPGEKQRFISLYAKNIGPGFAKNLDYSHLNTPKGTQFFIFPVARALGSGDRVLIAAKDYSNAVTFMGYSFE